jgi:hypothetical protein
MFVVNIKVNADILKRQPSKVGNQLMEQNHSKLELKQVLKH